MNTVEKGNKFEDLVFLLFEKLLNEYKLGFIPENCKIYKHKSYYSEKRKGDIDFDITIERFMEGQDKPSSIIFIECKNYNHNVPVDDIEEFNSKVEQIAPRGGKAILVTTKGFATGTLEYAKSQCIGLLKIFDDNNFNWVVPREEYGPVTYIEIEKANSICLKVLQDEKSIINNNFAIGYYDKPYNKLTDFFKAFTNIGFQDVDNTQLYYETFFNKLKLNLKFISIEEFDAITETFYNKFSFDYGSLSIPNIILYLQNKYGFLVELKDFIDNVNNQRFLAFTDYNNKKIFVSKELNEDTHRYLFTLLHELSHLILHESLLKSISECDDNNLKFILSEKTCSDMEIQANMLASSLLLPKKEFYKYLKIIIEEFRLTNRGYYIYLDNQPCNYRQFLAIVKFLQTKFPASEAAIKIRLKEIGFLKEARSADYFSIGNIKNKVNGPEP